MPNRCFVIGPMGGRQMGTLRWLAEEVIKPLLPDWQVTTPDSSQIGNVMTHVIKSCDRAQLVVAITNGNNPNVLYEIAVLDALGRACIPVKVIGGPGGNGKTDEAEKMPFDRAAYRSFRIHKAPGRRAETDRIMRGAIDAALEIRASGGMYQNPITDFFEVPLSSFSSAHGLARGYYLNLVRLAALALPKVAMPGSQYDPGRYAARELEVILPGRLHQAGRESVAELLKRGLIAKVTLNADGREITLYEWVKQQEPIFRWVDFPTTLATLRGNVIGRLGRDENKDPGRPEFRELEADEIDQFRLALHGQVNKDTTTDAVRGVVRIREWSEKPDLNGVGP